MELFGGEEGQLPHTRALDVTVAEPHLPEAIHQLFERTLGQD